MERISIFFFPYKFRYAGFIFVLFGIVAGYVYYFGSKPDGIVNGDNASVSRDYRITTKGFQSVYKEGNLTIIDYDAKVGDKYTLKHGSKTIVREVKSVSKEDDYSWGFMDIKVIRVEETGFGSSDPKKEEKIRTKTVTSTGNYSGTLVKGKKSKAYKIIRNLIITAILVEIITVIVWFQVDPEAGKKVADVLFGVIFMAFFFLVGWLPRLIIISTL